MSISDGDWFPSQRVSPFTNEISPYWFARWKIRTADGRVLEEDSAYRGGVPDKSRLPARINELLNLQPFPGWKGHIK